jgi:hypothetical protein
MPDSWVWIEGRSMSHWEASGKSNEWYTPKHVFDALGCQFDVDVASPKAFRTHVPAGEFITEGSLEREWFGFLWMNPPFGARNGLKPWLDKFVAHGSGIALVPDRTSAPWFRDAWSRTDLALFTPKLRFIRPDGTTGKSPSNGTALFGIGPLAIESLKRAAAAGLGFLAEPVATERLAA